MCQVLASPPITPDEVYAMVCGLAGAVKPVEMLGERVGGMVETFP